MTHLSFIPPSLCNVVQRCARAIQRLSRLLIIYIPAIREYDAKLLLAYWLERAPPVAPHAQVKTKFQYPAVKVAQISWDAATNTITPDTKLPGWVFNTKLVAKPDQLIKRRGKAGLLALNKTWDEAKPWIAQRAGKPQKVGFVPFFLPPPRWCIHPVRGLMENVFVIHLSDRNLRPRAVILHILFRLGAGERVKMCYT